MLVVIFTALALAVNEGVLVGRYVVRIGLAALALAVNKAVLVGSYIVGICSAASGAGAICVGMLCHRSLICGVGVLTKLTGVSSKTCCGAGRSSNCGLILVSAGVVTTGENARQVFLKQGTARNAEDCECKHQ